MTVKREKGKNRSGDRHEDGRVRITNKSEEKYFSWII